MSLSFVYKARSQGGVQVTGKITARNRREAIDLISGNGLYVVEIAEIKEAAGAWQRKAADILTKKVGAKELSVLCHQLAALTQAGIPLLQSLNTSIQQCENKILAKTLKQVTESLEEGASLANALELHPKVFPPLFVNMIKSGELSGTLEQVLNKLAVNLQKEYELTAKVKSAMIYPVAVVLVAVVSVVVLLLFVVPKFVLLLDSMAAPIPLSTRLILGLSSVLRSYWYVGAILCAGVVLGYKRALRTERGKIIKDKMVMKIPLIGPLLRKVIVARFCWSFSALLQAGVPVLQALGIVKSITENYLVMQSIKEAESSIKGGESISLPLQKSGVFPPLVVKMIAVGEETGAVDTLLEKAAGFYEKEVEDLTARLSSLIEPVLIVGVGGIIAFIILSVMLPVFSIMNYIN